MALFFSGKCEMASFFSWIVVSLVVTAVNHDFFKIFFSEMRNKRLIHCECLFWSRFQLLRNKHCINETNNPFGASTWAIFSGKRISFCLPLVEKWRGEQNLIGFLSSSKKCLLLFALREMSILYFVNCEKSFFFSVKRDPEPPLPPSLKSEQCRITHPACSVCKDVHGYNVWVKCQTRACYESIREHFWDVYSYKYNSFRFRLEEIDGHLILSLASRN